jgi:hypothetical protein
MPGFVVGLSGGVICVVAVWVTVPAGKWGRANPTLAASHVDLSINGQPSPAIADVQATGRGRRSTPSSRVSIAACSRFG